MNSSERALASLAQTYFDAAYDMDDLLFATIFHPKSSVTRLGDDGDVTVTPLAAWLEVVRSAAAPRSLGLDRRDEILSIHVSGDLALVKIRLQMPPRYFTDLLSCLNVGGSWRIVQKVMSVEIGQQTPGTRRA